MQPFWANKLPSGISLPPNLKCKVKKCPTVGYYNQHVPIRRYLNQHVLIQGYLIAASGAPTDTLPWMMDARWICLIKDNKPVNCSGKKPKTQWEPAW